MKLENQVVSLDLAKRLKELGVKQESLFWWVKQKDNSFKLLSEELRLMELRKIQKDYPEAESDWKSYFFAFTVAELGEMLKLKGKQIFTNYVEDEGDWVCVVRRWNNKNEKPHYLHTLYANTEADARAKMLIYLLENKLINAPQ